MWKMMKGEEGREGRKEGVKEGGESDAKLLNHFRVQCRQRLTMSEEKKKKTKKDGGEEKGVWGKGKRDVKKKSPNKRDISPEQNDKGGI